MLGARPEVETVMLRAPILSPQCDVMISSDLIRLGRLARGSPIPINTMLLIVSPVIFSTESIWAMISAAVRLRVNPASPDAQNLHP